MYVTWHARNRLRDRTGARAEGYERRLERVKGEPGHIAYVLDTRAYIRADDGSNGNTVVAVAIDGSVETVYFRRSDQDMSPGYFGAERVVRLG